MHVVLLILVQKLLHRVDNIKLVTKSAVFIDQNRPYSPDQIELKSKNKIDADTYFHNLCRLFDRVESELGLQVIIAVHPRAAYRNDSSRFNGRKMIVGETARLIGESKLVIGHQSTAIGFAVMFKKPVLIVTSEQLYNLQVWQKYYYDLMAESLGTKLHYFDEPESVELGQALEIDEKAYAVYMENYIKESCVPDAPYWQIAVNELAQAEIVTL